MRIFQLLPTLAYGDGVGNDVLAIDSVLKEAGYDTKIYAEHVDGRISRKLALNIKKMPVPGKDDAVICHLSTGSLLNEKIRHFDCRLMMIYHNITPPHFFEPYNIRLSELCRAGIRDMHALKSVPDYCLADSLYNKEELLRAGYVCDVDVVPIVVPFEKYKEKPDDGTLKRFRDGYTNILFVGRIAPNTGLWRA